MRAAYIDAIMCHAATVNADYIRSLNVFKPNLCYQEFAFEKERTMVKLQSFHLKFKKIP